MQASTLTGTETRSSMQASKGWMENEKNQTDADAQNRGISAGFVETGISVVAEPKPSWKEETNATSVAAERFPAPKEDTTGTSVAG